MARVVIKTDKGPYKLEVGDKAYYICMCGLSKNQPFCDGSHKATLDEEEEKVYIYDEDLNREELEYFTEYLLEEDEDDDDEWDDEDDEWDDDDWDDDEE